PEARARARDARGRVGLPINPFRARRPPPSGPTARPARADPWVWLRQASLKEAVRVTPSHFPLINKLLPPLFRSKAIAVSALFHSSSGKSAHSLRVNPDPRAEAGTKGNSRPLAS